MTMPKLVDQISSDSAKQDSDSVPDRTKEAEQALQGIIAAPQVLSICELYTRYYFS